MLPQPLAFPKNRALSPNFPDSVESGWAGVKMLSLSSCAGPNASRPCQGIRGIRAPRRHRTPRGGQGGRRRGRTRSPRTWGRMRVMCRRPAALRPPPKCGGGELEMANCAKIALARASGHREIPVLSRRTGSPRRPIPRMPPHPNPAGDDSGARSWFPVCQQGFLQFAPRGTPENTDIPHAQHGGKKAKCHFSGFFT